MRNQGCGTVFKLDPTGVLTTLVTFKGHNGASGGSPLTLIGSTLYGEAQNGGASADGLLFSVRTDGTRYTVLHTFVFSDGAAPVGGLRAGLNRVGYGVTLRGGTGSGENGVLFEIKADGTYTVLHYFTGGADGAAPNSLIVVPGAIFGSTSAGGAGCPGGVGLPGCGVVFQYILSSGMFKVIHSFAQTDGQTPRLGSIGADGRLYGAAQYGGTTGDGNTGTGDGTLFQLETVGGNTQFTTLVNFTDANGALPVSGPVLNPNGNLAGTTSHGSTSDVGTFYNYAGNSLTTLYSFGADTAGGVFPNAKPISSESASFIGTTLSGGSPLCNCGTIYRYLP
jgi:uncharacterized repeat protein (TIGR03803 family)